MAMRTRRQAEFLDVGPSILLSINADDVQIDLAEGLVSLRDSGTTELSTPARVSGTTNDEEDAWGSGLSPRRTD